MSLEEFQIGCQWGLVFTDLSSGMAFGPGEITEQATDEEVIEHVKLRLGEEAYKEMLEQCRAFYEYAIEQGWITEERAREAGTHFHCTRNRHGSGFWDGDWKYGKELTEYTRPFGGLELPYDLEE